MKIIDLVKNKPSHKKLKSKKPIELVSCLQLSRRELNNPITEQNRRSYYFYVSNYSFSLEFALELKRLEIIELEEGEFDVISATNQIGKTCLFLGHWNSGKIK